jgi:hypothetical protein
VPTGRDASNAVAAAVHARKKSIHGLFVEALLAGDADGP